MLRTTP